MKISLATALLGAGLLFGSAAFAQAPAGAIAQCKDGTYFTGTSHKGACKGHQGVKEWLDKDKSASTASSAAPASDTSSSSKSKKSKSAKSSDTTAASGTSTSTTSSTTAAKAAPAAAPAPSTPSSSASTTKKPPTPASEIQQKPGGGAGQVWVNSSSKVYHCQGDEWYGKTKEGSYMTEAAAKAAGNKPSHGKECSG